jgi:hypothetical protein
MAAEAAQLEQEPIPVTSWRPEAPPLAVAAARPTTPPEPTYATTTYGSRSTGRRFTEDPGRQL